MIIVAGIFILYQSLISILFPQALMELPLGMVLIGCSGVINGVLGYFLQRKGKELNSLTLEADGKHISTDAISSFVLIFGIAIIYYTGWFLLDSIISSLFALYIIYNGYFLVRRSVAGLMDESNPKTINKTVQILNDHRQKNWIDIHNMRVQQYGGDNHVDLHLTLPYYYDLVKVHDSVHEVEEVLEENLPGKTEVFVHADPCIPDPCCHYCQVEHCPVRKFSQSRKIIWTADNMSQNQKHYHELGQFKIKPSKND